MCNVSSGQGFRVAMTEGFSGKDVGGAVKVVITFEGSHLGVKSPIEKRSRLWEEKPETAKVSLTGKGHVTFDDVRMVSFRFPIKMFPKSMLSEDEIDLLDDEKISFIVRHYVPKESDKKEPYPSCGYSLNDSPDSWRSRYSMVFPG